MDISAAKKYMFWFIIGGAIVLMVPLYYFFTSSYRSDATKREAGMERALIRLEKYRRKGAKIANKKWKLAEEVKLEKIKEKKLLKYKELSERDVHIEKIFSTGQGVEIEDEAIWKNMYTQRVDFLYDALERSNVSAGAGALPFKDWGDAIPSWVEIAEVQKRYWIVEELLKIILKGDLGIRDLGYVSFRKGGHNQNNASSEFYEFVPFSINVNIDIKRMLFLIDELLQSKFPFEIETVNINRHEDSVVNVVIDAFVIDFKTGEGST